MVYIAGLLLAALMSIGGLGAPAEAPEPYLRASGGTVMIAGRPMLRIRTSLDGLSPLRRAEIVAARLAAERARGTSPEGITVVRQKPDAWICWDGAPILTVTRAEARSQRSEPVTLARLWAHRMRALLAAPALTVSRAKVVIPLGESRQLTFGGLLQVAETVQGGGDVVAVRLDAERHCAVLRSLKPGDARLVFTAGGVFRLVDVAVRPYAAQIAGSVQGDVTGFVTPKELVERVAVGAVRRSLSLQPDAAVRVGQPAHSNAVRAGHWVRLSVPVRVDAPGCLPVASDVPVTISNLRLPRADVPRLYYSNEPERVTGYGSLFVGRLDLQRPARLLYHHQNALGRTFALVVDVVNPGSQPARLHVTEGAASHPQDPIVAGHLAAREFLVNERGGIGYLVDLAPGSRATVAWNALKPGAVGSGVFGLRQLSGDAGCYVQVKADDPEAPFVQPPDGRDALSRTIFGEAVKALSAKYQVGGQWAFIRLGSAVSSAGRLSQEGFGDYGITYDIALTLSNPTGMAQKVGLVFEAASGKARGLFVVDGKMVETPTLSAHDEMLLAVYTLPPGGARSVRVSTLPLSGSAYPARLVARELRSGLMLRPGRLLSPH